MAAGAMPPSNSNESSSRRLNAAILASLYLSTKCTVHAVCKLVCHLPAPTRRRRRCRVPPPMVASMSVGPAPAWSLFRTIRSIHRPTVQVLALIWPGGVGVETGQWTRDEKRQVLTIHRGRSPHPPSRCTPGFDTEITSLTRCTTVQCCSVQLTNLESS